MKRNNSQRFITRQYVNPFVRATWFALTVLLIAPMYAGFDETREWMVLFPLLSVLTGLAGIIGVNPVIGRSKRHRVAGASAEQDSIAADAR